MHDMLYYRLMQEKLDGTLSVAEQEQLETWLNEAVENRQEFEDLMFLHAQSWKDVALLPDADFLDAEHDRLMGVLRQEETLRVQRSSRNTFLVRLAAVLVWMVLGFISIAVINRHYSTSHGSTLLVYNDAVLEQVIPELEKTYGITIEADAAIRQRVLTARFVNEEPADVMHALCRALDVTCEEVNHTYVLHRKTFQ